MPDDKNFFAALFDFSFQQQLTRRLVKLLYMIGILAGGITVVTYAVLGFQQSPADGLIMLVAGIVSLFIAYVVYSVVVGFQQSPAEGLIALVVGIVSLFVGILIWRVLLELALIVQRIAEGIERATHSGN